MTLHYDNLVKIMVSHLLLHVNSWFCGGSLATESLNNLKEQNTLASKALLLIEEES